MRIFVEFRGGTTLSIPFREASKVFHHCDYFTDSTICYIMPIVADAQGYRPHLKVHLNNVTVSSSLNDIRLLTTESCEVSR